MSYFGKLPSTGSQWWAALQLTFWGTLSWFTHPIIWIAFGPFRWMAFLQATAAQESTYNPLAVGDDGRSVGILQFYDDTWSDLDLGDLDRRTKIYWQAWAAGKYVQTAMLTGDGWIWRLFLPYFGAGYGRVLWTHGTVGGLSFDFDAMITQWNSEGNARTAWNTWRVISLGVGLLFMRMYKIGPFK